MANARGFVIGASFNSFVSFFDENIKKSQRVVRFYFLGKLNLTVHTVKITKKYVNREGISNIDVFLRNLNNALFLFYQRYQVEMLLPTRRLLTHRIPLVLSFVPTRDVFAFPAGHLTNLALSF